MATGKGSGQLRKRYRLPAGCSCNEFVMRELTNKDRVEAAIWADQHKNAAAPDDAYAQVDQRLHEAVRLALVAVDGEAVNANGVPYMALDKWTERTMTFAMRAYQDLNGIDPEEVEDFLRGAEIVSETPGPDSEVTSAP